MAMKRIMVVVGLALVLLVGATACQPTEPKMTITARSDGDPSLGFSQCETMAVLGKVTPATATPKVVLQRTVSGKWVDVKGWSSEDAELGGFPAGPRTAAVAKDGTYSINYMVDWQGTRHLRVRSNGGGSVSAGFYQVSDGYDGEC